jgi:hypothetical protein
MAARSRFHSEIKDHESAEPLPLHRSRTYNLLVGRWKSFRRRRIILVLLAGWLLYLFFTNMPTDLPPVSDRYDRRYGRLRGGMPGPYNDREPAQPSSISDDYEGPIRFFGLADTLQPLNAERNDQRGDVLFAVSDLESVPSLLPLACSMGQTNKSQIHLAFMGRDAAAWEDIRDINGVSECNILLHDARPDYPKQSSRSRLEVSARASLGHIRSALQLGAVITIDSDDEYFVNAVVTKSSSLGLPVLKLPLGRLPSLSWISALDAASLGYLNKLQIDIVIQAQHESSASLMRLLRSLKNADYAGWSLPRLTVELPNNVDGFLASYLAHFQWPADGMGSESRLMIRHRLDSKLMSPVQASMRSIESFYPLSPRTSHILMLSPSAELSPNFFQFLMYTVLEYKYGLAQRDFAQRLMGISLDLPAVAPDLKTPAPYQSLLEEPFVLWQAPGSNAALYFGERWVELHAFLSYRLLLDPDLAKKTPSLPALSHEFPAWLQPMFEMMETRGYYMLYPTFMLREGLAAVTVHRELAQSPEEFLGEENTEQPEGKKAALDLTADGTLTANEEVALLAKAEHRAFPGSLVSPFVQAVREKQVGADQAEITMFSFQGEQRQPGYSWSLAWKAAEEFAVSVGGCKSYGSDEEDGSIASLFCLAAS